MVLHVSASKIQDDVISGKMKIAVVGLGQVGLPQAFHFVKTGASVIGVDIDEKKINLIKQGVCPFSTRDIIETFNVFGKRENFKVTTDTVSAVKNSRVHTLCLPTPLGKDKKPDFSALTAACEKVGQGLQRGNLVIIESSLYPGITTKMIKPILERESGLKAGTDFGLAYCPERIDPGNTTNRVDNTPKIIGGINEASTAAAKAIYGLIVKAPLIGVRNCQTAELVKLLENIYRDVNIAFVNEIALLCEKMEIDVLEVLEAASTKWSFMPHIPGAGVGGMCIPINPHYLLQCAQEVGSDLPLIRQARLVNENMPHHMVELVDRALGQINTAIGKAKICVLGLAYKADIDDNREAPGEMIATKLKQMGANVICYDPLVTPQAEDIESTDSLEEAIRGADCIVIATDHSDFKSLELKAIARLANHPLAIVDGRHVLEPQKVADAGITYFGIGRTRDSESSIWHFRNGKK